MNLEQMGFRCPHAEAVETVRLEGYRLAFCGGNSNNGVATILPEDGSHVDGVLWRISEQDEKNLDYFEGWPRFYGKESYRVTGTNGRAVEAMAYTMNAPYKDSPAIPSQSYLLGILYGCLQNHIYNGFVLDAVQRTRREVEQAKTQQQRKKNTTSCGIPTSG